MSSQWISKLFGVRRPSNRLTRAKVRPSGKMNIVTLEDRITPVNLPSLSFDNSTLVVNEGSMASRTGFATDGGFPTPEGQTVSMTQSLAGATILPTSFFGTSSIQWDYLAVDGPGGSPFPVTITAQDPDGKTTVTFNLQINNVVPSVSGTYNQFALTGKAMNIDLGSFIDPGAIDNPWNVEADLDGNGVYETTFTKGTIGALGTKSFTYGAPGAYTAKVKVTDKDGGTSTVATFTVTVANDVTPVYVDDNWVGLPNGTIVDNDPVTAGTQKSFIGYDAWSTITGGLSAVTTGGTVKVFAGSYNEFVTVTKAVNLLGAQAGVDARGRVASESVITAPAHTVDSLVTINTANVTFDGFTVDGAGSLAGFELLLDGTTKSNVRRGIEADGNNIQVLNNRVQNVFGRGVQFSVDNNITGGLAKQNDFTLIGAQVQTNANSGEAILSYSDSSAIDNKVTTAYTGISYTTDVPSTVNNIAVTGNVIAGVEAGISFYLTTPAMKAATVSGNTVTSKDNGYGLILWDVGNVLTATNNTFTGTGTGGKGIYAFNGSAAPMAVTVTGGSISGYETGVLVTNEETVLPIGPAGGPVTITLSGVPVTTTATGTGVSVLDANGGETVTVGLTAGTTLSGGAVGLSLDGALAKVVGDTLNNTTITGPTDYVVLANGAYDNAANTGPFINGTGVTYDGVLGSAATLAQAFAIEDKVTHQIDDAGQGFLQIQADKAFVTADSADTDGAIQRGIDAEGINATGPDTVFVQEGTYFENPIVIAVAGLTVTGPNRLIAGNGARVTEAFVVALTAGDLVTVNANNVTVEGLYLADDGNSLSAGVTDFGATTYSGTVVRNNIFDTFNSGTGIQLFGNQGGGSSTGILVTGNLIGTGTDGISLTGDAFGTVSDNEIDMNFGSGGDGILVGTYSAVAGNLTISGNKVTLEAGTNAGIHMTGIKGTGTYLVTGNTVFGAGTGTTGIQLSEVAKVTVTGSTISQADVGISTSATVAASAVAITSNAVTNSFAKGIAVSGVKSTATVSGNTVTNPEQNGTGISVTASAVANVNDSTAANVVSGFAVGVNVNGATGNVLNNTIFDSLAGANFTNGGTGTVTGNTFNKATPYVLPVDPYVELEANAASTNNTLATAEPIAAKYFVAPGTNVGVLQPTAVVFGKGGGTGVGDVDFYQIVLTGTSDVTLDVDNDLVGTTFDTMVWLLDSGGAVLAGNDDNGGDPGSVLHGLDSRLTATGLAAGTYYVAVSRFSNSVTNGTPASTAQGGTPYRLAISAGPATAARVGGDNLVDLRLDSTAATVTVGAGNLFGGDKYFVENLSSQAISLTGYAAVNFEGFNPATKNDNYRIEDQMFHAPDASASGLITWVAGNLYVSAPGTGASDETINRAILAATTGNTVNVEAGTYAEDVVVGKSVTLLGAGSDKNPSVNGVFSNRTAGSANETVIVGQAIGGSTMKITAANVTVRGFDLNGNGKSAFVGYAQAANPTFDRNFVRGAVAGGYGIIVDGFVTGISITENSIDATGAQYGFIFNTNTTGTATNNLVTGAATKGSIGISSNNIGRAITVSNNVVSGAAAGLVVDSFSGPTPANGLNLATVTNNSLLGTTFSINNTTPTLLNAAGNWLGTNTLAGITAAVGGLATTDVSPFLWFSTNNRPAAGVGTGFDGNQTDYGVTAQGITFTGATRINEGVAFNAGSATVVRPLAGTYNEAANLSRAVELRAMGAVTIDSLTGVAASTLNLNTNTVTIGDATSTTFAGTVSGTGASKLVKAGAGTLTLSGNSAAYTGTGQINAGTLSVTGTFGGAVTVSAGGTLSGTGSVAAAVANGGTVAPGATSAVGSVGTLTVGNFSGAGTLQVDIVSDVSYDKLVVVGTVNVTGATLLVNPIGATLTPFTGFTIIDNDASDSITGTFTGIANNTSQVLGGKNFFATYTGNSPANDFVLYATTAPGLQPVTYADDAFTTNGAFVGDADPGAAGSQPAIVGFNAFAKIQPAIDATQLTGTIVVNDGVYVGDSSKLAAAGTQTLRLSKGAVATVDGQLSGPAGATVDLNRGTYSVNGGTVASKVIGVGPSNLVQAGAGTLTLTNPGNSYAGTTTVTSGTLAVGADEVIPNGSAVAVNGGTLSLGGFAETVGSLGGSGGTVDLGTGGYLVTGGNNQGSTYAGVIVGTGGELVKDGIGTMTLTGTSGSSYGKTTVNVGTLQIGGGGTTGSINSNVSVTAGASLAFNHSDVGTQDAWIGAGKGISGAGSVVMNGTGGLQLVNGTNTYTGGTVVNNGVLTVSADANLGAASGTLTVNGPGQVNYNTSSTARNIVMNSSGRIVVLAGQTLTQTGGTVTGGTIAGPGSITSSGVTYTGVTIDIGATITLAGAGVFQTVTNLGTITIPTAFTATLNSFTNGVSGNLFVFGTANATGMTTTGYVQVSQETPGVTPGGKLAVFGASPLTVGSGGVINIGYGTGGTIGGVAGTTAARRDRGSIYFTDTTSSMSVLSGGTVRNNGLLESPGTPNRTFTLFSGATYFFGDSSLSTRLNMTQILAGGTSKSGF